MKKMILTVGACLLMTGLAQAELVLINDVFSSSAIQTRSRFTSNDIDTGNWVVRTADGPAWAISGGELTNAATTTNDDKGAHLLNTVSSSDTSLTNVTVSFDYTVGAGSTLYFHSALYTGPNGTTGNMSRISQTGGAYFATGSDFNANFTSALNLKDGGTPNGSTGTALASLAGLTSGTFSQTYDISGYTGITSIADVSHILAVFTANTAAAGDGAISIDNFKVFATPEPTSFAMFLGGIGMLTMRRRRA